MNTRAWINHPRKLETAPVATLKQSISRAQPMVLLYVVCCYLILDLVRLHQVGRVNAINCAQILLELLGDTEAAAPVLSPGEEPS